MKRLLSVALVGCSLLAGCDTSGATSLQVYRDARYHFTFRHPSNWQLPDQGTTASVNGVPTYELSAQTQGDKAGLRLTVDADRVRYSGIPNGRVVRQPQTGDTLAYHRLRVSGLAAIQITRFTGSRADEIVTIVNTRRLSYDLDMLAANPPLNAGELRGYRDIIRSLRLRP